MSIVVHYNVRCRGCGKVRSAKGYPHEHPVPIGWSGELVEKLEDVAEPDLEQPPNPKTGKHPLVTRKRIDRSATCPSCASKES